MVSVGKSDQVTGKPSVELRLTRPTAFERRVNLGGNPVILATERAVGLQVALL